MLSSGMRVFLASNNDSGKRCLHPACITSIEGGLTVRSVDPNLDIEPGSDVLLFFEHSREFMQQPARVDALLDEQSIDDGYDDGEDAKPVDPMVDANIALLMKTDEQAFDNPRPQTFVIQTVGDCISAESRQCFRVSTVLSNRTATIGGESGCDLLDVSITGFSVKASKEYAIGEQVDAIHDHDGRRYTGKACVQSIAPLRNGEFRYGLYCVNDAESKALTDALQKISMAVQREQLRRRARA